MWDTILSFISEHYPLLFLILIVGGIVWLVAKKWFSLQHNIENQKVKIGETEEKIKVCENKMSYME